MAEIGLGMRYVPLIHLLGHACLRTLQFIRAPSLLHDYRTLENAIGEHLPHGRTGIDRYRIWLYRWSLERGYLDSLLSEYIVFPFVRAFRWCDGVERRWTDLLSLHWTRRRQSDQVLPHSRRHRRTGMNLLYLPWLELALAVALGGAAVVARFRDPNRAYHWGLACIGISFVCTLWAWLAFYLGVPDEVLGRYSPQLHLFGRRLFSLDELSASLVPTVALLHFLTAAWHRARTKMRRYSFSWSLKRPRPIRLATFSCEQPCGARRAAGRLDGPVPPTSSSSTAGDRRACTPFTRPCS